MFHQILLPRVMEELNRVRLVGNGSVEKNKDTCPVHRGEGAAKEMQRRLSVFTGSSRKVHERILALHEGYKT